MQAAPLNLTVHWRLSPNRADRYRILLQSDLVRFSLIAGLCKHGHIDTEGRGGEEPVAELDPSELDALRFPAATFTLFFSSAHFACAARWNRVGVVFRSSWSTHFFG